MDGWQLDLEEAPIYPRIDIPQARINEYFGVDRGNRENNQKEPQPNIEIIEPDDSEDEIIQIPPNDDHSKDNCEKIPFDNRKASRLFGDGKNEKFLHPIELTYNADFVVEVEGKCILLHKNLLIDAVPYFRTFGEDSDFTERNREVEIKDEMSGKTLKVHKISLQDCNFDPERVCEYFSFLYKQKVDFSKEKYLFDYFRIADFFSDEVVANMILKRIGAKLDLDSLAFAWKHPILRERCLEFINSRKNSKFRFYRSEHIKNNWKNLPLFYNELVDMNIELFMTFILALKSVDKIDENIFAYFIIEWFNNWHKTMDSTELALKLSKAIGEHDAWKSISREVSQKLYQFLILEDKITSVTRAQIHKNCYGTNPISKSEKRKAIQNELISDNDKTKKRKKNKSDFKKKVDVKIEPGVNDQEPEEGELRNLIEGHDRRLNVVEDRLRHLFYDQRHQRNRLEEQLENLRGRIMP